MIRNFEPAHPLEPEDKSHLQWRPAIGAGLIAGLVLLVAPRGSPWSALTFFAPVIMGRVVPAELGVGLPLVTIIHLGLSMVYGLVISRVVVNIRQLRALITGGVAGLVLYLLNFAIVYICFPALSGSEFLVAFTHFVFGLIAGGAYRGLLRRAAAATPTSS